MEMPFTADHVTKEGNTPLEVAVFARFVFLSHMQVLLGFVCAPSEDELTLVIVRFGCFLVRSIQITRRPESVLTSETTLSHE